MAPPQENVCRDPHIHRNKGILLGILLWSLWNHPIQKNVGRLQGPWRRGVTPRKIQGYGRQEKILQGLQQARRMSQEQPTHRMDWQWPICSQKDSLSSLCSMPNQGLATEGAPRRITWLPPQGLTITATRGGHTTPGSHDKWGHTPD